MNITSRFENDFPAVDKHPGAYEWWYYDAVSANGDWAFVIIFYDGCPFSPSYNKSLESNRPDRPDNHPAISLSVYHKGKPVFYSMSEYEKVESSFSVDNHRVKIKVGKNEILAEKSEKGITHTININESFPSGDALIAEIVYKSIYKSDNIFPKSDSKSGHGWNLTMPKAKVTANGYLTEKGKETTPFAYDGSGYHDHNLGFEPMKNEFIDWYWGRFHFKNQSLIYYIMRTNEGLKPQAWLIDDFGNIKTELTEGSLRDFSSNVFLLSGARTIELNSREIEVSIHQTKIVDSGPFYYRYLSDVIIHDKTNDSIETAKGITEYIHPSRIHWKPFWPLVHMRYRYVGNPHWVQKSPTMYRWTW